MEVLGLCLVVFTIYVTIRLAASASGWILGNRFRAYRTLAERHRGRYENRGLSDPPTVNFSHGGSNVRVGLAPQFPGQNLGPRTRVVARFRVGIPFRLELTPVTRSAPAQAPKGTRLVRVGDPAFDQSFVVQANDVEMARAMLSPEVRLALRRLQQFAPPSGMLVSINPERLLVQVDRNLATQGDLLLQAVDQALIVHDGLQAGVSSRLNVGIVIVEVGLAPAEESGPPICKVCGDPIVDSHVVCATCQTPHHGDCWEFIGACSIYGCSGKNRLSIPARIEP